MLHLEGINKKLIWNLFLFVLLYWTGLEAPISYVLDLKPSRFEIIVDIIFFFAFSLDFYVVYLEHKSRKRRYDHTEDRFDKLRIALNFLCIIPYDWFDYFFNQGNYLELFSLIRMLRFAGLFYFIILIRTTNQVIKFFKLGFVTLLMILFIHWISCVWILVNPISNADKYTIYNTAFYWAVTSLTTVGYGDITPQTNGARIFTVLIMMLGVGFYGVVIGYFSNFFLSADKFRQANSERMEDLGVFMKHYRIPLTLQRQVFSFYEHLLGTHLTENDTKIISELPLALQEELKVYMKLKMIRNISIFKSAEINCLKEIAKSLTQVHFCPGDLVIKKGEIGEELFMIGHGQVEILSDKNEVVAELSEGQFFGERALLEKTLRSASVRAKNYCDLYTLSKEDFVQVMQAHPKLMTEIKRVIKGRYNLKHELEEGS